MYQGGKRLRNRRTGAQAQKNGRYGIEFSLRVFSPEFSQTITL